MEEGGRREGVIQDDSSQSGPMERAANAIVNTPQSSPLVWEGGGLEGTRSVHSSSSHTVDTQDLRGSRSGSTNAVRSSGNRSSRSVLRISRVYVDDCRHENSTE